MRRSKQTRRWKYSIHYAINRISDLFDKKLNLVWKYTGDHLILRFNDVDIWDSRKVNDYGGGRYDYLLMCDMARIIADYYDTPLDDLVNRTIIEGALSRRWRHKEVIRLYNIFLAADRRIGKYTQRVWLFTTSDQTARNISGARII